MVRGVVISVGNQGVQVQSVRELRILGRCHPHPHLTSPSPSPSPHPHLTSLTIIGFRVELQE